MQLVGAVAAVPMRVMRIPPNHPLVVVIDFSLVHLTVLLPAVVLPLLARLALVVGQTLPQSAPARSHQKAASRHKLARLVVVAPLSLVVEDSLHLKSVRKSSRGVILLEIVQIVRQMR